MNVIQSMKLEAIQNFEPKTAREKAICGKCRLRNAEINVEDSTFACPCEGPDDCGVLRLVDDEVNK